MNLLLCPLGVVHEFICKGHQTLGSLFALYPQWDDFNNLMCSSFIGFILNRSNNKGQLFKSTHLRFVSPVTIKDPSDTKKKSVIEKLRLSFF